MPLNIDWQQILLHWMNLAILAGGLYFLLCKQEKLEGAEEEIHQTRAKIQQAAQQSAQEQLTQAQAQAKQIVDRARTEAEHSRERALKESQRELRRLAAEATRRLALQEDPFDQFLDLAERGEDDEE